MSKACGAVRLALLALVTLAPMSVAQGDTAWRTRVTIRGTGSDIRIERTQAPAPTRLSEKAPKRTDALAEAARLKAEGAEDDTIVAYFRVHEADLPLIVAAEDMRRLRKAGAGEPVLSHLARIAAIDIGETGEGAPVASSPPLPASDAAGGYAIPYGYLIGGGYSAGAGYAAGYARRFRPHGLFPFRRPGFPRFQPGRPLFPRPFPPQMPPPPPNRARIR
jgi:hypothetical protein